MPSRHRRDSCSPDEVVGGFFFDFEAIRTASSDRDAPRRWDQQIAYRHGPHRRYARVLARSIYSPLMRGLAPTIALLSVWSVFVFNKKLTITANGLGFLASPIGLLLAFRVNSCVSRFHAAREMWGRMTFACRDVASTLSACSEIDAATKARCGALLTAYAWCAKSASTFEEPPSEVVSTLLNEEDSTTVLKARKPALTCLSLVRKATIALPLGHHVGDRVEINQCVGCTDNSSLSHFSAMPWPR